MDAELTAEQQELRRTVRELAADRASSARRREVVDGPTGHDAELWRLVATELGLAAITVAESGGGMGGSFVDAAVVLEEAGRALLPVPLLPTIVAATACDDAELAGAIAAGSAATLAVAGGPVGSGAELTNALDGHLAGWILVATPAGLGLFTADAAEVEVRTTLDPTRRQATVRLTGETRAVGDAAAAARAVDLLRVALAVESVGVARWCLGTTVDYLKTREQFDRPIGSFQALQHRAADLMVMLESAAATATYAAWTASDADDGRDELPVVAPLALAVCADAAYRIAAETIQMHGGIGFTWEHDAHLYFKRATTTSLLLGDSHVQRRLVAQRVGLTA